MNQLNADPENSIPRKWAVETIVPSDRWGPAGHVIPVKYREMYQKILDLEVYDDDVWIVSFPRSGTHWMQEILCCLLHGKDLEKLRSPQYRRSTVLETGSFSFSENVPQVQLDNLIKFHETLERPRVLKTHLFWDKLPKALRDANCKAKIVYVARNPKDVCISNYHYYSMLPKEEYNEMAKSLDFFSNEFLADRIGFGPYWTHLNDYWSRRDHPRILFVRYEDMKANLSAVLDRLQTFFNQDLLTDEEKQKITDHLSFEKMRNNDSVNFKRLAGKYFRKTYSSSGEEANFIRKGQFLTGGFIICLKRLMAAYNSTLVFRDSLSLAQMRIEKVGAWKTEMSPQIIKKFDEWILKNYIKNGPYEPSTVSKM